MVRKARKLIGWREWVSLPGLGVARVKAKVDTGARSSALHAFDLEVIDRNGRQVVRFAIHPFQRSAQGERVVEHELHEWRWIRSSTGHRTLRPVILTDVDLAGDRWPIELTLVGRDTMGFRMLLGRSAVRRRFLIDAGRSYLGMNASAALPEIKARKKKRNRRETP
jgi:hypothetical protein